MANWFYYNEKGEKIGVTGRELKELAKAGLITPDTIVETEEGKSAPARKVKGLTFGEPAHAEVPSVPPVEVNPFTITMPTEPNPFTASKPTMNQAGSQGMSVLAEMTKKLSKPQMIIGGVASIVLLPILFLWICNWSPSETMLWSLVTDVKTSDDSGRTSLYWLALDHNALFFIRLVVLRGADVNQEDKTGDTPLHQAAVYNNPANVKYLIEQGADVNAKNRLGETPLLTMLGGVWYRYREDGFDLPKYMIRKGADVNEKDKQGMTALHHVARYAHQQSVHNNEEELRSSLDALQYLIDKGADVNALATDTPAYQTWVKEENKRFYPPYETSSGVPMDARIISIFRQAGAKMK